MPNQLQVAGAALPASDFAPLHVNRQATGMWPNTNPLRDASTNGYTEANYGGKKDSYVDGKNCEVSNTLTLIRRPGCVVYNSQIFPAINRFYGWNTFTIDTEDLRLMVDTAATVYDGTGPNKQQVIWTKAAGAGPTFFLGVGNTLYMTNGKENLQLSQATGLVTKWGVDAPLTAPTATQAVRANPYPNWQPNTGYGAFGLPGMSLVDTNGNVQRVVLLGTTGAAEPAWNATIYQNTADGTVQWENVGPAAWVANHGYVYGDEVAAVVSTPAGPAGQLFMVLSQSGPSGATAPAWTSGYGTQVADGGVVWQNIGPQRAWADYGASTPIVGVDSIIDPNGYQQTVVQSGKSGANIPANWATLIGAFTTDGTVVWQNKGPFAVAGTAPTYYGYAALVSATKDISNMSPRSAPITVLLGNQVTLQGLGTAQGDTLILYRTAQGGATFLEMARIPNPGAGVPWSYVDNIPDSDLNTELQAQVGGEGTPLPIGATCLAYHVGRIFAAVGNVVYVSSGPDAIASGSSGNAGFDTTFTAQAKIIRFWVSTIGVLVLTVRDVYIILGDGTDNNPLFMKRYIEKLPLLNYDAFTVLYSTAYLFGGQKMVGMLDPGSGIVEASFPIAPLVKQIDPKKAYCTFHVEGSGETALYLSDGKNLWYRMCPTSAPEQGLNWSPRAEIQGGMSALQSVEVLPGESALLIGPGPGGGPIRRRDTTVKTDAGTPYPVAVDFNPITLANPGQLAGLAWMTLKCSKAGTAPKLGVVLDEISGPYEDVPRTRQDPTNLPPSKTIISNRHSLLQGQDPVWCQVIKFGLTWAATDTPDELLTYTIFGQTWQEQRSQ